MPGNTAVKRPAQLACNNGTTISRFMVLFRKDLREQLRSGLFLTQLIVFVFFGILSPVAAQYTPLLLEKIGETQNIMVQVSTPGINDAFAQYVKNFTQLIPLIMIFLTMGGIAREKDKGTLAYLLVKPVSRIHMIFSKISAVTVTIVAGLAGAVVFFTFYSRIIFGDYFLAGFLRGNLFLMLYLLTLVIIVQSLSAIFSTPVQAGIGSMILWFTSLVIQGFPGIGRYAFTSIGKEVHNSFLGMDVNFYPFIGAAGMLLIIVTAAIASLLRWE